MTKFTAVSLAMAGLLCANVAFADDACCAKTASSKAACADFSSMHLTAVQKTKLETWQSQCMKEGCTTESRTAFLKKAEGILSKDQYATLKSQCEKGALKAKS